MTSKDLAATCHHVVRAWRDAIMCQACLDAGLYELERETIERCAKAVELFHISDGHRGYFHCTCDETAEAVRALAQEKAE